MRLLFTFLLFVSFTGLFAQSPSAVVKEILIATEASSDEAVKSLLWSKASQDEMIKNLSYLSTKYGKVNFFLLTDSASRTSRSQPKKYIELKYNAYYKENLQKYEFMVVEEKGKYKLASFVSNDYKGNYNDPLVNYGTLTLSKMFAENVAAGKTAEAYNLFTPSLQEDLPLESFQGMVDIVNDNLGELISINPIDTCTALNFYGDDESMALFTLQMKGTKGTIYFNGSVSMTNAGTFFLTRFQLCDAIEMNNLNEIKNAEKLIDDFYFALSAGDYERIYQLLHPELREIKSLEDITVLLEGLRNAGGKHKSHTVVSDIFTRNRKSSDLNKFMLIVRNENEKKVFHDNFVIAYDKENNLKVGYFYFVEY